ncbi:Chloride channel protein [Salmonella bongori]|nr:Chloride channel protein [Salmonella bongori]
MLHPRARTMLLLSLPALIIGVASSLLLIAAMKIASVFQQFLWQRLPASIGIAYDSPFWMVGILTLTGIVVGLIIRYSPGHAGPDPAIEPLISMPVSPSALPGLLLALIIGLAGGVSLGPEHPIMTVNIALAVAFGSRLFPRITALDWTILASAGTIGALFGTPVAAALIFSQTLSGANDVPVWDRLFAPLMAAAAGSLTTSLFFQPHFSLPIAHYTQMRLVDIASGAIVATIAIAAGMVAVWCLPRLHELLHRLKNPVLILGIGGFMLGILGLIGGPLTLFKGLDEMQQMAFSQTLGAGGLFYLSHRQTGRAGYRSRERLSRRAHFSGCVYRRGAGAHAPCPCRRRSGGHHGFLRDTWVSTGGNARRLAQPVYGGSRRTGYQPVAAAGVSLCSPHGYCWRVNRYWPPTITSLNPGQRGNIIPRCAFPVRGSRYAIVQAGRLLAASLQSMTNAADAPVVRVFLPVE